MSDVRIEQIVTRFPFLVGVSPRIVQFVSYLFIGGAAAIVDFASFIFVFVSLGVDYRVSLIISFSCGALANFTCCNLYLFKRTKISLIVALGRHYMASLGGLLVNALVMMFLIEILKVREVVLAKIVAMGVAFVVNFVLICSYAFRSNVRVLAFPRSSRSVSRSSDENRTHHRRLWILRRESR